MENELINEPQKTNDALIISEQSETNFKTASQWAYFLSIIGFIYTGLMLLAGIMMVIFLPFISKFTESTNHLGFPLNLLGFVYIIGAALYFFPTYYMYNFAEKVKAGILNKNQETVDQSFKSLRNLFKFMGIMTLISLVLFLLMIPAIFIFTLVTKM